MRTYFVKSDSKLSRVPFAKAPFYVVKSGAVLKCLLASLAER